MKLSQLFGSRFGGEEFEKGNAPGEMTMSCCMREPMETAQCLGDDTHAAVARPKQASEHGLECGVVPVRRWGVQRGTSTGARRSGSKILTSFKRKGAMTKLFQPRLYVTWKGQRQDLTQFDMT